MCLIGCVICKKPMNNMEDYLNHIDREHPDVAEKIKQEWRKKGLIK